MCFGLVFLVWSDFSESGDEKHRRAQQSGRNCAAVTLGNVEAVNNDFRIHGGWNDG
jgi:hypothetical protein